MFENKAQIREEIKHWREQEVEKTRIFKEGLEKDNGMIGHPKADLLFEKAWDLGHSSGYEEVKFYYEDLIDLVK